MTFADFRGDNLPGGQILNRRQIPAGAPVHHPAQIAAPDLMRVCNRQIVQQVVVGVMWRGDGAVAFDPSPRWAQVELRHHPLGSFVIDAQVHRDPTMTVSRMLSMHRFNNPFGFLNRVKRPRNLLGIVRVLALLDVEDCP